MAPQPTQFKVFGSNPSVLGYAIATILEAIALQFLNPAGSCYSMTFYTVQLL
ncbi:MAG: hypothetical protein ACYTXA_18135 [Nostoc sp.]